MLTDNLNIPHITKETNLDSYVNSLINNAIIPEFSVKTRGVLETISRVENTYPINEKLRARLILGGWHRQKVHPVRSAIEYNHAANILKHFYSKGKSISPLTVSMTFICAGEQYEDDEDHVNASHSYLKGLGWLLKSDERHPSDVFNLFDIFQKNARKTEEDFMGYSYSRRIYADLITKHPHFA